MSLDVGDKIGINRHGVKSYVPAVGDKCCFIGNRAIHTRPVGVGDRIGHRKYGYKSTEGETRTTCWNSIARMELNLGVSSATIHTDYTTAKKYRYEYAHYSGQYGDDYATVEVYCRSDKYYCLGYKTDNTTASSNMNLPAGCDVYLFVNGDMVDYILADEFVTYPLGATPNYYRFGNIDAYLKKDGTKERISLYIRPYDGITAATVVYVDILEMDYETCLTPTRQTAGYYAVNSWKVHDAKEFQAPVVEWTLGDPRPQTYDEYTLEFTARAGCKYAVVDFWQQDYQTIKYHTENTYSATYGMQWKPVYASWDILDDYNLYVWINGNLKLTRFYNVYADWVWWAGSMGGGGNHCDMIDFFQFTIPGTNIFKIRYPYLNSVHYWDPNAGQWKYIYENVDYSAVYLVELQTDRILS